MSKIIFTGKFKTDRKELEFLADIYGEYLRNGTDFLVYGKESGSRLLRAKSKGMAVFSEYEFLNLIELFVIERGYYE
jgi:NAD-dependent DNA ligase